MPTTSALDLPARWTQLPHHPTIAALNSSPHRFNAVPAGRRSLKSETRKRKVVISALTGLDPFGRPYALPPRLFLSGPTRDQAKRIFWNDLKLMVPDWAKAGKPSESELVIRLKNGAEIHVLGMDKPERFEGSPWDGGGLDEFANMKREAWGAHVFPALADRQGWCDLFGVPEGRNHYYEICEDAKASVLEHGDASDWGFFTWPSADILPASEIELARRMLDELTFAQEYEASFVNFTGRAYYAFGDWNKAKLFDRYNPRAPLIVCLDFNVAPGVAVICQEMTLPADVPTEAVDGVGIIGEVHIPRNSDTEKVVDKIGADWGEHQGKVILYGDATGGAGGSAKVRGSDWDLVRARLPNHFARAQTKYRVPKANPRERARVNSVNSLFRSAEGVIRCMIDPHRCPMTVRDFEGVRLLEGGSGEIDKKHDLMLTHLSDAFGYFSDREYPVIERETKTDRFAVV